MREETKNFVTVAMTEGTLIYVIILKTIFDWYNGDRKQHSFGAYPNNAAIKEY